jgi:hypothetical protein
MEEGWFPGNPEGNYGIDHERLCPIRSGMDLAQDLRRQLVQLATALRRCLVMNAIEIGRGKWPRVGTPLCCLTDALTLLPPTVTTYAHYAKVLTLAHRLSATLETLHHRPLEVKAPRRSRFLRGSVKPPLRVAGRRQGRQTPG